MQDQYWSCIEVRSFSSTKEEGNIPTNPPRKHVYTDRLRRGVRKYNIKSIYMDIEDFNLENFINVLTKALTLDNTYSLLVKVQYTNVEGDLLAKHILC